MRSRLIQTYNISRSCINSLNLIPLVKFEFEFLMILVLNHTQVRKITINNKAMSYIDEGKVTQSYFNIVIYVILSLESVSASS